MCSWRKPDDLWLGRTGWITEVWVGVTSGLLEASGEQTKCKWWEDEEYKNVQEQ